MNERPMLQASALTLMFAACGGETIAPQGEAQQALVPNDQVAVEPVTVAVHPQIAHSGDVCLYGNALSRTPLPPGLLRIGAGDRLVAEVTYPDCLSTSCDVSRVAACTIESRADDTLVIDAFFSYASQAGPCTNDCGLLTATCESEPLDAGEYVVLHAGEAVPLTVPSTANACPLELQTCQADRECSPGYCAPPLSPENASTAFGRCRAWLGEGQQCGAELGRCEPGLDCAAPAGDTGTCVDDLTGMPENPQHPDDPPK